MPPTPCAASLPKSVFELQKNYPTREDFLKAYNPALQAYAASHPDRSFFGTAPTLAELNLAYGKQTAAIWLVPQLTDFSLYSKPNDPLGKEQLEQCAKQIAADYGYLKASELLLFFHRMKGCKYGKLYNLSPMYILEALKKFVDSDRCYAHDKRDSLLTQKRIDENIEQNRQSLERNPGFDPMQLSNFRRLRERYGEPKPRRFAYMQYKP